MATVKKKLTSCAHYFKDTIAAWVINVATGTGDKQSADFSNRGVTGDEYKLSDIPAFGKDITSTRALNTAKLNRTNKYCLP